jgi:toxin ParE1/3/4
MGRSTGCIAEEPQARRSEVKPVIVTALAQTEIDRTAAWYENRREGLGGEFLDRVDEAIQRIEMNPEGYAPAYKDLRRAVLRQFTDWALWFEVRPDNSLVIACLSGRRHPVLVRERQAKVIPFPEKPPDASPS